jgi:glycosyltransferase involved in cell wall biosynthesis
MISVIVPSRGESASLWSTVISIRENLRDTDHEIIVVANEQPGANREKCARLDRAISATKRIPELDDAMKLLTEIRSKQPEDDFPMLVQWLVQQDFCRVIFSNVSGPAAARNLGASHAKGDFLFFSDAHCEFPCGYFKAMRAEADRLHADAVFGGTRFMSKTTYGCTVGWNDILWGMEMIEPKDMTPYRVASVGHGVFGITVEAFDEVGGYWNALEGWGGEEPQLNFKLWLCGKRLWMVPSLFHYHYTMPGARRGFEMYADRDFVRNFLLTAAAYGGEDEARRVYQAFTMNYWVGESKHPGLLDEVLASPEVAVESNFVKDFGAYENIAEMREMFRLTGVIH